MICKHCGCDIMVKDGIVAGKQRWKCSSCHKTSRENDKRERYETWKKILVIRLHCEGKNINEIKKIMGGDVPRPRIADWIKNYEKIMKKELKAFPFPRRPKEGITIMKQRYWKELIDVFGFDTAFGIIWTNKGTKLFIMGKE